MSVPTRLSRVSSAIGAALVCAAALAAEPGAPIAAPRDDAAPAQQQGTPGGLWTDVDPGTLGAPVQGRSLAGNQHRTLRLDTARLTTLLGGAPLEGTPPAASAAVQLELPWPDGATRRFGIYESPMMEPALAAQFPELKTYGGYGLDDPTASLRFDWTPSGFHAMVLSADGTVYIDPYAPGDVQHYIAYFRRDYQRAGGNTFTCGVTASPAGDRRDVDVFGPTQAPHGTQLRTYRLAMAATGEYTTFHGGTVQLALAGIVTTMNRVNGLYERDVAVRMVLVANNNLIVYTNGATDPYTNNNGLTMLGQNQSNLDAVIGSANYDIGHVFSTGGGGIANLGAVCNAFLKARGVTGSGSPIGDAFDVDYVAHEIGHQFNATHTFNGTTSSCGGGNRTASTAYEPGSGSTIMAYAGICGAENLQLHSDAVFHAASQTQMIAFVTNGSSGGSCPVLTATGNTVPAVNAGADVWIPQSTPFTLTASASDADGDALTYLWEEFDLGTQAPPNTDDGSRPIFRSFPPSASPSRTFPKLSDVISNVTTFGESLPTTMRNMTFRVTVRDNRASGGGTVSDDAIVGVSSGAGPFLVTQPNTAVSWPAGTLQPVTWDVANTHLPPINTANVSILLSVDGGVTYPIVLAASTPNDGGEFVAVPNVSTALARVRVQAVGSVYFDISNADFSIAPAANFVQNGSFAGGAAGWLQFATPDLSFIVSQVSGGVFEFYRVPPPPGTANQAVVFQPTGFAFPAGTPLHAQFLLGNSSSVRKRVSVLLQDADFFDLHVCTFWLPPNLPLTAYQMQTHTTKNWTNATVAFYAATAGSDGGFYRIDDVVLQYAPAQPITSTDCIDPTAPAPPGGADGPQLLASGDFTTGTLPPWSTFGTITTQIAGGVLEFIRPSDTPPAGVVLQDTGQTMAANQILRATFQLGNSSAVRKRVTAILHANDFSDLSACTFWLPPGQPLLDYEMRTYATQMSTNFTVSFYPATTGPEQWITLDNVVLQRAPSLTILGTECLEPGS